MDSLVVSHVTPCSSTAGKILSEAVHASNVVAPRRLATLALKLESSFSGGQVVQRRLRDDCQNSCSNIRKHELRIECAKKVVTGRSYVLSSTLVAEEGKAEEVVRLCKGIVSWAEERKKDGRMGVLHFDCNSDAFDANVLHFWERYEGFNAMNDTRASPEHCKFMDEVRPLLKEPVALAAYEYNDGQIGCMLNPIGPKGEGGLDDATGQGGSGGGASYKQTSSGLKQGLGEEEEAEGRGVWGLANALELSSAKAATAAAAAKIAEGLANLFGQKKKE